MQAAKVDNKEIVRRVIEAVDSRDHEVIAQLMAPTLVVHMLFDSVDPITGEQIGYEMEHKQEDFEKYDDDNWKMFPEQHTTVDAMFDVGDDKVVTISTTTSTHRTGKKVKVKAMGIDRIENGKIVESWGLWDRLGYWQQLGLAPPTPQLLAKFREM